MTEPVPDAGIEKHRLEHGYTAIDVSWIHRVPFPMPVVCAACSKELSEEAVGKSEELSCKKKNTFGLETQTLSFSGEVYLYSLNTGSRLCRLYAPWRREWGPPPVERTRFLSRNC